MRITTENFRTQAGPRMPLRTRGSRRRVARHRRLGDHIHPKPWYCLHGCKLLVVLLMCPHVPAADATPRDSCEQLDLHRRVVPKWRITSSTTQPPSQPKMPPTPQRMRLIRRKFVAFLLTILAILPWALLVIIPVLALSLWAVGIGH